MPPSDFERGYILHQKKDAAFSVRKIPFLKPQNELESVMNIKSSLKNTSNFQEKLRALKGKLYTIRASTFPTQTFSELPRSKNKINHVEKKNITIIDETDRIVKQIDNLISEHQRLSDLIELLEDPFENIVMRLLYVNFYSWEEVERALKVSHPTIQRARKSAIQHLEAMADEHSSDFKK